MLSRFFLTRLWKESVYTGIYGHQFHQYQQSEQSPLILTELNELKKTMTCDIGNPGLGLGQAQKCGRGNVKVCNFLRYVYVKTL
jgi:hypothetical protein